MLLASSAFLHIVARMEVLCNVCMEVLFDLYAECNSYVVSFSAENFHLQLPADRFINII